MDLAENLKSIRNRISEACARSNRDPGSVELLAVTKNHPPGTVNAAAELGLTLFGENRVQEARAKIPLCSGRLRWHMIGHLQSNKCRETVELFAAVESVDSLRLAEELNTRAGQASKRMPIFLEVNIAGEGSKFGYRPDQLLEELSRIAALRRLDLVGLMTVPPYTTDPERVRGIFRQLREMRDEAEQRLGASLPQLSMGMSGDFEVAIEEGATLIRIGTALFGPRKAVANVL